MVESNNNYEGRSSMEVAILTMDVQQMADASAYHIYSWWRDLSPEDQQKLLDFRAGYYNAETKDQFRAIYNEIFAAADANGDGLLNADEMIDFFIKQHQNKIERGVPSQDSSKTPRGHMVAFHERMNKMNPEVDGITKEEIFEYGERCYAKFDQLRHSAAVFDELVSSLSNQQFEWFKALSQEEKESLKAEQARKMTSEGIQSNYAEFNSLWNEAGNENGEILDKAGLQAFYIR